jgi:hypothetical protein
MADVESGIKHRHVHPVSAKIRIDGVEILPDPSVTDGVLDLLPFVLRARCAWVGVIADSLTKAEQQSLIGTPFRLNSPD